MVEQRFEHRLDVRIVYGLFQDRVDPVLDVFSEESVDEFELFLVDVRDLSDALSKGEFLSFAVAEDRDFLRILENGGHMEGIVPVMIRISHRRQHFLNLSEHR